MTPTARSKDFIHGVDKLNGFPGLLGEHNSAEIACHRIVLRPSESTPMRGWDFTRFNGRLKHAAR